MVAGAAEVAGQKSRYKEVQEKESLGRSRSKVTRDCKSPQALAQQRHHPETVEADGFRNESDAKNCTDAGYCGMRDAGEQVGNGHEALDWVV